MGQEPDGPQNVDPASEDTSRAEQNVRNAEENRDALDAQKHRTDATTSSDADRPIGRT